LIGREFSLVSIEKRMDLDTQANCLNLQPRPKELAILAITIRPVTVPKTETPCIVLAKVGAKSKDIGRFEEEVAHVERNFRRIVRAHRTADLVC
jgi:hypothetical protein